MRTTFTAAITAFALLVGPAHSAVVNGDFEDTSGGYVGTFGADLSNLAAGPGRSWDVYQTLPGWMSAGGAGIEVQTNRTLGQIDSHDGGQH